MAYMLLPKYHVVIFTRGFFVIGMKGVRMLQHQKQERNSDLKSLIRTLKIIR